MRRLSHRAPSLLGIMTAALLAWPSVGAARPPAPSDEPVAGAPPAADAASDEKKDEEPTAARNIEVAGSAGKSWSVTGRVQFRTLVVTDEDPANGRSMIYWVQGAYKPLDWLMVLGRVGLEQRFVAQPDENGVRMQDAFLAGTAMHSVDLADLGWDRKIGFMHQARVYFPTSYESQIQDLYTTLEWRAQTEVPVVDGVTFGVLGLLQYRFHKYAERAGPEGGTLPRVVMAGLSFLEYAPLRSKTFGTLTLGADIYGFETIDYPARPQDSFGELRLRDNFQLNPDDLVGDQASDVHVGQQYGYDFYVTYIPPLPTPSLAVTLSWEQGGSVLRNGVVNTFAFHRDETQIALSLTARY